MFDEGFITDVNNVIKPITLNLEKIQEAKVKLDPKQKSQNEIATPEVVTIETENENENEKKETTTEKKRKKKEKRNLKQKKLIL